jgi:hypothetical protein
LLAEKGVTYFRSDQNNFGIKILQNFQSLGRRIEEKTYRMMACERNAAIGLELGAAAAAHKKYKSGRHRQKKETKESRDRHGYQSRETLNTPPPSLRANRARSGACFSCLFPHVFKKSHPAAETTRFCAGLHWRRTELDGEVGGRNLAFRTRSHLPPALLLTHGDGNAKG